MSYTEKLKKLEKLVAEIENDQTPDLDELRKKISEAKKLHKECEEILHQTEEEIQSMTPMD